MEAAGKKKVVVVGGGDVNTSRRRLNPNWSQLQLLLKAVPKPNRIPPSSVLGKRKERSDAEVDGPSSSILVPTSEDCSLTGILAMDCEMVGVGADGTKSALGRVTLVNTYGNVIYDEFVRPLERIVDFRTAISGIRPYNMRKARDFHTVQKKVAGLIKGRVLVGHALHNDLKVLFLIHPKKDIRDTSEYQPFLRDGKRVALRHLAAQILGVRIQQNEHCSVEDARAAMFIYQKYKRSWEKSIKAQPKFTKKGRRGHRKKHQDEDPI